jgi:hypothetical protein
MWKVAGVVDKIISESKPREMQGLFRLFFFLFQALFVLIELDKSPCRACAGLDSKTQLYDTQKNQKNSHPANQI